MTVGDSPAAGRDFTYQSLPMRVRFGRGALRSVASELDHLGIDRALVVCTPGHRELADGVAATLGARCVGVLAEAVMHVPVDVAARARAVAAASGALGGVAVGGGSTVGLAKAIALTGGLRVVAVPTTYAGSEMTPVWGLTEAGVKRTGRDPVVLPASVIYDPDLTHSLPVGLSVTSGMNAVAHAAEALYAPDASPVVSLMAEEGVRAMLAALPRIAADPGDPAARADALYAAWLCGACLGATTMSLHHRLCHALGGTMGLPHAETHTVVLPHVLAFNAPAVPGAMAALRRAVGGTDPVEVIRTLPADLGAPTSLRALGVDAADLPAVAAQVLAHPYANPRPVDAAALAGILDAAWSGTPAAT